MAMMKIRLAIALLIFGASLNFADETGFGSLVADVALEGAFVGLAIKDLTADSLLCQYHADLRFTTASNLKLFTSAAAIELLDPSYRFVTSFYINGQIKSDGMLDGDLIVFGGGDPLISGRFRDSVTEALECWADSLAAYGIKKITGDLVVDNSFFEDDVLGPGWSHDDLSYWYACQISALSFNDNCVDIYAYPSTMEGEPCRIVLDPQTDYIDTINNAVTLPAGAEKTFDFCRYPGGNLVEFFGGVALDDTDGVIDYVSVDSPQIYCAFVLRDVLRRRGLVIEGDILERDHFYADVDYISRGVSHLFDWFSDSLGVVISVINKNSQNFFAEQTLKTMGAEICGEGSFQLSTELVADWLDGIGITRDDVHYHDGSGLSYTDLARPSAIIKLLEYMYQTPGFDTYYESLAIPGVDRSVKNRLAGQPLAAMMRTKTGHIVNARTFSGYLTSTSGHLIAFALMVNNYSADEEDVDGWMDRVCAFIIENY